MPHNLLVANVSTERLGNCGIIFYRTDLQGKRIGCAVTRFYHRKIELIFAVFAIFGNVKSNITFSMPHIHLLSIQFTCL